MNPSSSAPFRLACAWAVLLALLLAPAWVAAVNVNQASLAELQAVRGIGPKTAQNIVAERERAGPYASLADLSDRVRGIGARKAAALQAAGLSAGPAAGAPAQGRASAGAAPR